MALEGNVASSGVQGALVGAGVGGLLGGSSSNESYGYGTTSGSSYEAGGSTSSSWGKTYGTEASARDIARTEEANALMYDWWKQNANYNMTEAEKSRAWQEYMSNTSYQRAVQDMKKAGLNPILAALNSGASTPSGATASSSAPQAHKATTYADQESGSTSSSYNVGGSQQYGINLNMSSGKSQSLIHDIVGGIKQGISSLGNSLGFKGGGSSAKY